MGIIARVSASVFPVRSNKRERPLVEKKLRMNWKKIKSKTKAKSVDDRLDYFFKRKAPMVR